MGLAIFRESEEYNNRNDTDINIDIVDSDLHCDIITTDFSDITNPKLWNIDLY